MKMSNSHTYQLYIMISITMALQSKDIIVGETYPVAEPNPIVDIQKKLQTNKTEIEKRAKAYKKQVEEKLNHLENDFSPHLTPAPKDDIWAIDTSYILDYDVPDGKGGYLYRKGFRYDPKDYIDMPINMVVINGNSKNELSWAEKKGLFANRHFKILLTGGKIVPLMREYKQPLYFYMKPIHERFKLKHTPTIIRQAKDRTLYAYEFKVDHNETQ